LPGTALRRRDGRPVSPDELPHRVAIHGPILPLRPRRPWIPTERPRSHLRSRFDPAPQRPRHLAGIARRSGGHGLVGHQRDRLSGISHDTLMFWLNLKTFVGS
jgi:hypothetical protein